MRAIIFLGLIAAVLAQLDIKVLRQAFDAIDADDDGSLVLSELQAYFDNIDANKDGFLNLQEYSASRPASESRAEIEASFDYSDRMDGQVDNKIARSVMTVVFNRRLDVDSNGKLTEKEFVVGYYQILVESFPIVG